MNTTKINYKASYKKIAATLNEVNPNFSGFDFNFIGGNIELMLKEKGLNSSVHVSNISDGTLRYLCLLAILFNPDRGRRKLLNFRWRLSATSKYELRDWWPPAVENKFNFNVKQGMSLFNPPQKASSQSPPSTKDPAPQPRTPFLPATNPPKWANHNLPHRRRVDRYEF